MHTTIGKSANMKYPLSDIDLNCSVVCLMVQGEALPDKKGEARACMVRQGFGEREEEEEEAEEVTVERDSYRERTGE